MKTVIANIQAFPLRSTSYQGTPTTMSVVGDDGNLKWNLVHLNADATLTVVFEDGTSLEVAGLAGQDFVLASNVSTITSTSQVLMS